MTTNTDGEEASDYDERNSKNSPMENIEYRAVIKHLEACFEDAPGMATNVGRQMSDTVDRWRPTKHSLHGWESGPGAPPDNNQSACYNFGHCQHAGYLAQEDPRNFVWSFAHAL